MEKALREGLDAPEIDYALGNALFKKGEVARASEEYDRVLAMAPGHSGALFLCAGGPEDRGDGRHPSPGKDPAPPTPPTSAARAAWPSS